jgi:hypothetical protein
LERHDNNDEDNGSVTDDPPPFRPDVSLVEYIEKGGKPGDAESRDDE